MQAYSVDGRLIANCVRGRVSGAYRRIMEYDLGSRVQGLYRRRREIIEEMKDQHRYVRRFTTSLFMYRKLRELLRDHEGIVSLSWTVLRAVRKCAEKRLLDTAKLGLRTVSGRRRLAIILPNGRIAGLVDDPVIIKAYLLYRNRGTDIRNLTWLVKAFDIDSREMGKLLLATLSRPEEFNDILKEAESVE